MAKTTISQAHIALQKELASQGLDLQNIDRLIAKSSLDAIMADTPALTNYFRSASKALSVMTDWDYGFKAVHGAVEGPESFRDFFQHDIARPIPLQDYIPEKYFANPQLFVDEKILTPEQGQALRRLLNSDERPLPPPPEAEVQRMTYMPTSAGKALGTAGSGVSGTAYGTATGSKNLGAPPPPEAGGFSGESDDATPEVSMEREREYIDSLQNDPNYGLLQMVFGSEQQFRSVSAGIISSLHQLDVQQQQYLQAISQLDPRDPDQARQLYVLQQNMQSLDTTRRELMDKLGIAQRTKDELVSMIKSMMDVQFKTMERIISNTGR